MTGRAVGNRKPRPTDPADPDPAAVASELDGLLFAGSGWFAIDAANRRVPHVAPGTLEQALALLGRGRVATVVGQLRPEVAGVDVDAPAALGDTAAETLRDWCAARGLWHLLRPSGGGAGRWHVLVVPGVHGRDLGEHVDALRRELGLSRSQLDLRRQLRPLSAPHRRRGSLPLPPGAGEALAALSAALEPVPERVRARRTAQTQGQQGQQGQLQVPLVPPQRTTNTIATANATAGATAPGSGGGPVEPLVPLSRPRRELPAPWAAYLARGRGAAREVDRDPATRSQLELEATFALVVAGYSEPEAWAAVTAAHRSAFPKARSRGRRWWWYVWNRCVVDADAWLRARRAEAPAARDPLPATTRARAALDARWRDWPARTRHTDVEVYRVVLARMDRVGASAVPVPQRDLVLDCAVASRTTVRAALTRLQAAGLLCVDATYVPGTTDTAHTLRLPEALTTDARPFEHDPASSVDGSAVSLIDPSRCQPPQRAPLPLPLRRALGLAPCAVHAHLPAAGTAPGPTPLLAMARASGLLAPDQDTPTAGQLRTLRGHLRTLARYGLVAVDEHGHWRAVDPVMVDADGVQGVHPLPADQEVLHRAGRVLGDTAHDLVVAERAAFREALDPDRRRARWQQERRDAVRRAASATKARQKAWWDALEPQERDQRWATLTAAFAALSPAEQAARKHALATDRARAGHNERTRYDAWLQQLPSHELEQRSVDRALAYAARPSHDRQHLVATWTEHRTRWSLPHHRQPPRLYEDAARPQPASPDAGGSPADSQWIALNLLDESRNSAVVTAGASATWTARGALSGRRQPAGPLR